MNAVQFLASIGYSLEWIAYQSDYSASSVKSWSKGKELSNKAKAKFNEILSFYLLPTCEEIEDDKTRFSVVYRNHTWDESIDLIGAKLRDTGNIVLKRVGNPQQGQTTLVHRMDYLTVNQLANFINNTSEKDRAFIRTAETTR